MDLLKIATAGSVDDGKSTLIGRLMYEAGALKQDQLQHIEQKSRKSGYDYLDFSLATDGLLAEREQGITIDVSHIYFSTPSRRFVIADSPGHVEYTRNMITGASTANLSLILVDARKGITAQTRRHFYISCLLGIKQVVLCINKMDLVDYSESRFNEIVTAFSEMADQLCPKKLNITSIPVSALHGENIATNSELMPWYKEPALLPLLESVKTETNIEQDTVFQVQYVLRPKTNELHDYRAYLGKVRSGVLRTGDPVVVYPEGQEIRVKQLEQYGERVEEVQAGVNCSVMLEGEFGISRGQILAGTTNRLQGLQQIKATICWMDNAVLTPGKVCWLQYGTQMVKAKIQQLNALVDTSTFESAENPEQFALNDIGEVSIQLASRLFVQPYLESRANGAFILIDNMSNTTAGVGFIR